MKKELNFINVFNALCELIALLGAVWTVSKIAMLRFKGKVKEHVIEEKFRYTCFAFEVIEGDYKTYFDKTKFYITPVNENGERDYMRFNNSLDVIRKERVKNISGIYIVDENGNEKEIKTLKVEDGKKYDIIVKGEIKFKYWEDEGGQFFKDHWYFVGRKFLQYRRV